MVDRTACAVPRLEDDLGFLNNFCRNREVIVELPLARRGVPFVEHRTHHLREEPNNELVFETLDP